MKKDEIPYEIATKEVFEQVQKAVDSFEAPNREAMLDMLDEMLLSYENLPRHAKESFATNADVYSALLLVSEILRAD